MSALDLQAIMAVPYKEFGYDFEGWNCWGLVNHVFAELNGLQLPQPAIHSTDSQALHAAYSAIIEEQPFYIVDDPQPGDMAAVYQNALGPLCHIGIVIDCDGEAKVLHIRQGSRARTLTLRQWKRMYFFTHWWRHG